MRKKKPMRFEDLFGFRPGVVFWSMVISIGIFFTTLIDRPPMDQPPTVVPHAWNGATYCIGKYLDIPKPPCKMIKHRYDYAALYVSASDVIRYFDGLTYTGKQQYVVYVRLPGNTANSTKYYEYEEWESKLP